MRRLGISIYPDNTKLEDNISYIQCAAKYGYSRIFMSLLSLEGGVEETVKKFKTIISEANKNSMEVIIDVAPSIFKPLNITYNDLSFFSELGAAGIRLDEGFSGAEEAMMTFNSENLKIEINISNGTKYLDNIISYKPKMENLIGCHNFYPHRYTGLSLEHFLKCSKDTKDQGVKVAAFVSSPSGTIGIWPVAEGLPTVEMHREMALDIQAKHLFATELVDDVIIGNAFATEDELKLLSEVDPYMISFKVVPYESTPSLEKKIMFEERHFNRGDVSEYVVRSTQSRVKYKGSSFPAFNTPDIKRGDILVESDLYKTYAGELQVALKPMKNSGKTNVVGHICEDELFLLDYIKPWQKFKFVEVD